jgi:hypothetical protein
MPRLALLVSCGLTTLLAPAGGADKRDIARERLEVMASRIESIDISSNDPAVPKQMQSTPLFRYDDETSDGAIFLFANGRNPAVLVVVETGGKDWQYGIGRLSMPSTLEMKLDDVVVWSQPRFPQSPGRSEPYNSSNSPAKFP